MKNLYLTIDYELFFGSITGSVQECMINPTQKLIEVLEYNNSKMTVFWDILHYKKCLEYADKYSQLKDDANLLYNQVQLLITKGHDVQLHLHPHWLDAVYVGDKWIFPTYEHFSLQSLSNSEIEKCVETSISLMKEVISYVKPNYTVNKFRAGAYLIEPFDKLSEVFKKHGIFVDSSVCTGLFSTSTISEYDFRNYPKQQVYKFNNTPKFIDAKGAFTEYPIRSIEIGGFANLYFKFLRRLKYPKLEVGRIGTGVNSTSKIKNKKTLCEKIFKKNISQLTTDGMFKEKFNYLINKSFDKDVMILHPKLLNQHTLHLLNEKTKSNKIKFKAIPCI